MLPEKKDCEVPEQNRPIEPKTVPPRLARPARPGGKQKLNKKNQREGTRESIKTQTYMRPHQGKDVIKKMSKEEGTGGGGSTGGVTKGEEVGLTVYTLQGIRDGLGGGKSCRGKKTRSEKKKKADAGPRNKTPSNGSLKRSRTTWKNVLLPATTEKMDQKGQGWVGGQRCLWSKS